MLKRLYSTVSKQNKKAIITVTNEAGKSSIILLKNLIILIFYFRRIGGGCNGFKYILEQTNKEEVANFKHN